MTTVELTSVHALLGNINGKHKQHGRHQKYGTEMLGARAGENLGKVAVCVKQKINLYCWKTFDSKTFHEEILRLIFDKAQVLRTISKNSFHVLKFRLAPQY